MFGGQFLPFYLLSGSNGKRKRSFFFFVCLRTLPKVMEVEFRSLDV